jgi:hypothetical protein
MSFDRGSGLTGMSKVRVHIAVSADGYVAGPNQSLENPLGEGGGSLHDWAFALRAFREPHGMEGGEVKREHARRRGVAGERRSRDHGPREGSAVDLGRGATIRGGAGGVRSRRSTCPCSSSRITRRAPLTLSDTTFTFVTDGIESALDHARSAAAGKDVVIGGGASVINQYLAAGLVDELELHIVPLVLGGGARLFDGVGPDLRLEQVRAIEAPGVAHLKYRVVK